MHASFAPRRFRAQRRGLTLIELVMVLIILASLAAMIVPIVDNLRRTSDKSTASATMKQVVENLSLYRTQTSHYPDRMDSLLDSSGSALFSSLHEKLNNSTDPKLAVSTLATEKEAEGFEEVGIRFLLDHDLANAARGMPGNSGLIPRAVTEGTSVAVLNLGNAEGLEVAASIYPQLGVAGSGYAVGSNNVISVDPDLDGGSSGDEYTIKLVCLGVGPGNTAIGNTMVSPPAYPSVDGVTTYNRYIAVFAVYDGNGVGGEKLAQLKAALDSKGDFLNEELNEVVENAPK